MAKTKCLFILFFLSIGFNDAIVQQVDTIRNVETNPKTLGLVDGIVSKIDISEEIKRYQFSLGYRLFAFNNIKTRQDSIPQMRPT